MANGNGGWICWYRKVWDHWTYRQRRRFSAYEAWLDLVMMANHAEAKTLINGHVVIIPRGSILTSVRGLAARFKWSVNRLMNFLKLCKNDQMLDTRTDTAYTMISICNYESYQPGPSTTDTPTETPTDTGRIQDAIQTIRIKKNQEEEKKKIPRRASGETPNPDVKVFIDWFAETYEGTFDRKYVVQGAKDGKLIKALLAGIPLDDLKRAGETMFGDPWARNNGASIGLLSSQINKWLASNGQAGQKVGRPEIIPPSEEVLKLVFGGQPDGTP